MLDVGMLRPERLLKDRLGRTLLVSHRSVRSEAAVRLTTRMLTEAADHPEIGRAEALRRSMPALMGDPGNPHFTHPLFWAMFVVVGEAGVRMRIAAGGDWYRVARGGNALGYVYGPLIRPREGVTRLGGRASRG